MTSFNKPSPIVSIEIPCVGFASDIHQKNGVSRQSCVEEMVTSMYHILYLFKYISVQNARQKNKTAKKHSLQLKPPQIGFNDTQS